VLQRFQMASSHMKVAVDTTSTKACVRGVVCSQLTAGHETVFLLTSASVAAVCQGLELSYDI